MTTTKNLGDLVRADCGKQVTYKNENDTLTGTLDSVMHNGGVSDVTIQFVSVVVLAGSPYQTIEFQ